MDASAQQLIQQAQAARQTAADVLAAAERYLDDLPAHLRRIETAEEHLVGAADAAIQKTLQQMDEEVVGLIKATEE